MRNLSKHTQKSLKFFALVLLVCLIVVFASIWIKRPNIVTFSEAEGDIFFYSSRRTLYENSSELFAIDEDGENISTIRLNNEMLVLSPVSWAPNGKSVAFTGRKLKEGIAEICIYILHVSETTCLIEKDRFSNISSPRWSPNGEWISFTEKNISDENLSGSLSFFLVDMMTKSKELIFTIPGYGGLVAETTWSPNSQLLAFSIVGNHGNAEIWLISVDGSESKMLTIGAFPAWSPKGDEIAFVREGKLWSYHLPSAREQVIVEGLNNITHPTWSPNGDVLLFEATIDDNSEIFRLGVHDAIPVNITNHTAHDGRPSWRP